MLKQRKNRWPSTSQVKIWMSLILLLLLVSLACSMRSQDSSAIIRIAKTLPTITPTLLADLSTAPAVEAPFPSPAASTQPQQISAPTPTPPPTLTPTIVNKVVAAVAPTHTPAQAATPTVTATPSPTLALAAPPQSVQTPTATSPPNANPVVPTEPPPAPPLPEPEEPLPPQVDGWSFVGVRTLIDKGDTVLVGELINNTGTPQKDIYVSGVFYDKKGKVTTNQIDTLSYVPIDILPVGAHAPFELIIESPQPIYRVELYALSEPSGDPPRQDFLFSNVSHWIDTSSRYCIGGEIQNPGPLLQEYLVILAITYNAKGHVASFGEFSSILPKAETANQPTPFEMCIDPLGQNIVSHELKALGL